MLTKSFSGFREMVRNRYTKWSEISLDKRVTEIDLRLLNSCAPAHHQVTIYSNNIFSYFLIDRISPEPSSFTFLKPAFSLKAVICKRKGITGPSDYFYR